MANPYAQGLGGVGGSSYPQAGARSASPRRSLYDANSRRSVYGSYGLNDSPYRTMEYRYGRDDQGPGPQTADYRYGRDDKSGEMMPMVGQSMPYYAPPQRPSFRDDGIFQGPVDYQSSRSMQQAPYSQYELGKGYGSGPMPMPARKSRRIDGPVPVPLVKPRQDAPKSQQQSVYEQFGLGSSDQIVPFVTPGLGSRNGRSVDAEYSRYYQDMNMPSGVESIPDYQLSSGQSSSRAGREALAPMPYRVGVDFTNSGLADFPTPSSSSTFDEQLAARNMNMAQPSYSAAVGQLPSKSSLPSELPPQMRSGEAASPQATTTTQAPVQGSLQQRLQNDPAFRSQWMTEQIRNNTPFAQQYHAERMKDPDYAARVRAAEEAVRIPDAPQYQPITNITGADRKPLTNPGPASAVGARYEGGPTQQQMADYGVTPYSVALGQNRTYDNVAPGTTGATRDLSRAAVANAYDPQSWYTMGTTPAEQQADAAKRVANVGANYQSTIRQDPYSPLAGPGAAAGYNAMAAQDKARQQASDAAYQANRQKNLEAKAYSDAAMRAQGLDPDKERRESATLNAQYYNYIRASRAGGTKPVSYTDFAAIMKGGNAPQSVATQQPKSLQAPVSPTVLAQYALPAQQVAARPDEGSPPAPMLAARPDEGSPPAPQMPTQQSTVPPAPQSYYDSNIPSLLALDSNPSQWNQTGARINDAIFPPLSQEAVASEGKQAAPMAPQQPAAPVPAATAPTASAQNPASDPNYPFNNTELMPTPASRNLPTRDELENMLQAQRNSVNQARQAVKDDRERRRLVGGPSLPMAAYMMNRYGIPMTLGMPREEAERQRYIENLGMSGLLPASYRANVIAQQQANLNNNTADVNQELIRANALRDTALTRGLADVQSEQVRANALNARIDAEKSAAAEERRRENEQKATEYYRQQMLAIKGLNYTQAQKDDAERQVLEMLSSGPMNPQMQARLDILRQGTSPNVLPTSPAQPTTPPAAGSQTSPSDFGVPVTPATESQTPPATAGQPPTAQFGLPPGPQIAPVITDPGVRSQKFTTVAQNLGDIPQAANYDNLSSMGSMLASNGLGNASRDELLGMMRGTPMGAALSDPATVSKFLDEFLDRQSKAVDEYQQNNLTWGGMLQDYASDMFGNTSNANRYGNIRSARNEGVAKFNQQNAGVLNVFKSLLGDQAVNDAIESKYRQQWFPPVQNINNR